VAEAKKERKKIKKGKRNILCEDFPTTNILCAKSQQETFYVVENGPKWPTTNKMTNNKFLCADFPTTNILCAENGPQQTKTAHNK